MYHVFWSSTFFIFNKPNMRFFLIAVYAHAILRIRKSHQHHDQFRSNAKLATTISRQLRFNLHGVPFQLHCICALALWDIHPHSRAIGQLWRYGNIGPRSSIYSYN